MKKGLTLSLLSSAILLAGCGDDTSSTTNEPQYESYIQDALSRSTSIDFTLQGTNANVPLPSFALMNTSDATLELPTGGDDALTNPIAAMGTMDGWSTSMPITMAFEGTGLADGVIANGVYLVELSDSMTGSPTPSAILSNTTDFTVYSSSETDSLTIVLHSDLNPSSEYILALTSEITDENGDPVGTSGSYAALKSSAKTYTTGSLATAQQVTQGIEALFQATGVDSTTIVYSTWFSTQSVGDTLYSVKGATATGLAATDISTVWKDSANPNSVNLSAAYTMSFSSTDTYTDALNADTNFTTYFDNDGSIKTALISQFGASGVYVSEGVVQLPYYLETGDDWNSQPFESAMPSLALISEALSDSTEQATIGAQLVDAGIDSSILATDASEQLKLIGVDLTKSDGSALDSNRYITRYNPVPKIKSLQSVDFILFTPSSTAANWPVVIYQHGITSVKENTYFFAANLAAAGYVVIAIDQPLHGSRSLDSDRSANSDITAYLNLNNLAVARDNVRQSALDIMGLRASLSYSQAAGLLASSVLSSVDMVTSAPRFLGHSLGGVTGLPAVAAANRTINNATGDAMYAFSSFAAANTGGQISNLLLNSDSYGPLIKHSVAASSSTEYQAFASENCSSLSDSACYTLFEANATSAQQSAVDAGISQFAYATQTLLDTIDPYTNASHLSASLPTYLLQVKDDDTVPNSVTNTFAGTIPLATKLSLATVDSSNTTAPGAQGFVRFSDVGQHSTFIFPQDSGLADAPLHSEMMAEVIDFLGDNSLDAIDNSSSVLE
ncbi:VolA/Pla-1 family phospholipase [Vibrio paucivorans]|uniref:Lipase n=1 Tax=Vibrio paucivorans TaxID=2829489 RepID=A0A9X3HNZ5_9VIBR|nr:VolA/Pla-1 family phospholipase [Vibrio paucivorans]MCW8332379.1 lipase [Vibrio paucivorans]